MLALFAFLNDFYAIWESYYMWNCLMKRSRCLRNLQEFCIINTDIIRWCFLYKLKYWNKKDSPQFVLTILIYNHANWPILGYIYSWNSLKSIPYLLETPDTYTKVSNITPPLPKTPTWTNFKFNHKALK